MVTTGILTRATLVATLLVLVSCAQRGVPQGSPGFRAPPQSSEQPPRSLNSLQRDALQAMQNGDHDRAIQYLQRAIRIEPRDPINWHYLAQSYQAQHDFTRCREMISRSRAYSRYDSALEQANQSLAAQCACQPGERCE